MHCFNSIYGRKGCRFLGFCLLLVLLLGLGAAPARAEIFSDIEEEEVSRAVDILYSMGIVNGMDSRHYAPEEVLTRAQFSKMIVLALGKGDALSAYNRMTLFQDVPSQHWAAGYVNLSSSLGLIKGYGDGSFGPEDSVLYGQAITILLRSLGYTSQQIGYYWPADYVSFAENIGLDGDRGLGAYDLLTRGDAAVLILGLLNSKTANGQSFSGAESSTVENAILLSRSATATDGTRGCAMFYVGRSGANGSIGWSVEYYEQNEKLSKSLLGASGTVYLDGDGLVSAFVPDGKEYHLLEGLLLSTDSRSSSWKRNCAAFYIDGEVEYYSQIEGISSNSIGSYGYILLNENDYVFAFLPQKDADLEQITVEASADSAVYFSATSFYSVNEDSPVVYMNEAGSWLCTDWDAYWAEIRSGVSATLLMDGDTVQAIALWEGGKF